MGPRNSLTCPKTTNGCVSIDQHHIYPSVKRRNVSIWKRSLGLEMWANSLSMVTHWGWGVDVRFILPKTKRSLAISPKINCKNQNSTCILGLCILLWQALTNVLDGTDFGCIQNVHLLDFPLRRWYFGNLGCWPKVEKTSTGPANSGAQMSLAEVSHCCCDWIKGHLLGRVSEPCWPSLLRWTSRGLPGLWRNYVRRPYSTHYITKI